METSTSVVANKKLELAKLLEADTVESKKVAFDKLLDASALVKETQLDLYQSMASADVDVVCVSDLPPYEWYVACGHDFYQRLLWDCATVLIDATLPASIVLYGIGIVHEASLPSESWQVRCGMVCYAEVLSARGDLPHVSGLTFGESLKKEIERRELLKKEVGEER